MNREIKFRGKRKDNDQWVEGSLIVEYDGTTKIDRWVNTLLEPENNYWEPINETHEVYADSVGQLIDLKDKNSKEIFEGDLIQSRNYESLLCLSVVMWDSNEARFIGSTNVKGVYLPNAIFRFPNDFYLFEIIGNIHDNPELLNAASATTSNSNMNIDPNGKAADEVKEQPAEQATEATGTESAEEGGTEG